ncbi:MAG: endolytic transglycosylase MltG [Bacteroidetes bacterium]|nr:endolytic transglycosylase MltG [Bacteroidota bacterium]
MKKRILWILLIVTCIAAVGSGILYARLFTPAFSKNQPVKLRIRSGWNLDKLATELERAAGIEDKEAFVYWANKLGYKKVWPCTIDIEAGEGLYHFIQKLKTNRHQTANVVIRGSMDKQSLALAVSEKLEINPDSLILFLGEPAGLKPFGVTDTTWACLFIPNTYNLFVNTGLKGFMSRIAQEYRNFWNSTRLDKARKQGLTPIQAAILASIVTKESNKTDEYQNIAGVYINRLRKGMLLQADPTVVFARGRSGRVLGPDLRIQSPYNTYLYKGLPPGPLCIPNKESLEAVLNYTHHNYLYFCAKADFSNYHQFAETLEEHNRNARAYHRALDALP